MIKLLLDIFEFFLFGMKTVLKDMKLLLLLIYRHLFKVLTLGILLYLAYNSYATRLEQRIQKGGIDSMGQTVSTMLNSRVECDTP